MRTPLSLCLLGMLLTGCAGTASNFECNDTTFDRCMTMEQANKLAREKTQASQGKLGAGKLPAQVDLPRANVQPGAAATTTTPRLPPSQGPVITPAPASRTTPQASLQQQIEARLGRVCAVSPCDNRMGEAPPVRLQETVATLWVAPWIDETDMLHQSGRISFTVQPGSWALPQRLN